jgi:hypothetical protein
MVIEIPAFEVLQKVNSIFVKPSVGCNSSRILADAAFPPLGLATVT